MWVKELHTHNLRNLHNGRIQLESGLNWFCGENGQGKTNLLEAVYFSLTGKSFRTSRMLEVLREPKEEALATVKMMRKTNSWEQGMLVREGKGSRQMNGKACKAMDFFRQSTVICFTARSKSLVEGAPEDRRRFLDRMICSLDPQYLYQIAKYRKIHKQLKPILVKRGDLGVYRSYKQMLIPQARLIVERRQQFLDSILERATGIFRDIFDGDGDLDLSYRVRGVKDMESYERTMMDVCAQELLYGRGMVGPHLDDLDIQLKSRKAGKYASSGQVRAIVLSTKLAVREAYGEGHGSYPILLLDDLDAELDERRLNKLLKYLQKHGQTLISTSKYGTISSHFEGCIFVVDAGRISPQGSVNDK